MERSTKAGSQLDFYPRKMLFLFPRRCIRTIGISREEIEDVTSRSEGSAGRGQTSPADIRAEHVRLLRFSSPRRDASSISSLSAALLSARTCARQYRSKQPPRNSSKRRLDFTRARPILRISTFPSSPPPTRRIRSSRGERDRRGKMVLHGSKNRVR